MAVGVITTTDNTVLYVKVQGTGGGDNTYTYTVHLLFVTLLHTYFIISLGTLYFMNEKYRIQKKYNKYRNTLNNIIREAKKIYLKSQLQNCSILYSCKDTRRYKVK